MDEDAQRRTRAPVEVRGSQYLHPSLPAKTLKEKLNPTHTLGQTEQKAGRYRRYLPDLVCVLLPLRKEITSIVHGIRVVIITSRHKMKNSVILGISVTPIHDRDIFREIQGLQISTGMAAIQWRTWPIKPCQWSYDGIDRSAVAE